LSVLPHLPPALLALADGTITIDGDPADLGRLVAVLAPVDRNFPIVTP